ncbi:Mitochondrial calcium uniporter, putative [Leishmania lindenbergi]|uniref:Mitochondrial calcium uniporter n=1 Tax=Leishmania lindenbergi TaxID=651832 RepID=A0AAW3AIU6_9TRYP
MLTETFLRKAIFARCAIDLCGKKILPKDAFVALLTQGHMTPSQFQMSDAEAVKYIDTLKRAKMVVVVEDYVYTDVKAVIDAVHLKSGLPLVPSTSKRFMCFHHMMSESLAAFNRECSLAMERAVRREKEFWAFTALVSGIQMLVLAYLTFQVYGWDVMEPVTFFVTTATALCSYAYFLCFRTEHSYESVDDNFLPHLLMKELSALRVDANKVIHDMKAMQELQTVVSLDDERVSKLVEATLEKKSTCTYLS